MTSEPEVADLCFAARALAQAHPLTERALAYLHRRLADERARQPVPEPADWAGTAMVVGYCLRRIEETHVPQPPPLLPDASSVAADLQPAATTPPTGDGDSEAGAATLSTAAADLEAGATALADTLRGDDPGAVTLLAPAVTVAALDRLVATELDKRREHMREQLDDDAWAELAEYLTWWVVHGYCTRATEAPAR